MSEEAITLFGRLQERTENLVKAIEKLDKAVEELRKEIHGNGKIGLIDQLREALNRSAAHIEDMSSLERRLNEVKAHQEKQDGVLERHQAFINQESTAQQQHREEVAKQMLEKISRRKQATDVLKALVSKVSLTGIVTVALLLGQMLGSCRRLPAVEGTPSAANPQPTTVVIVTATANPEPTRLDTATAEPPLFRSPTPETTRGPGPIIESTALGTRDMTGFTSVLFTVDTAIRDCEAMIDESLIIPPYPRSACPIVAETATRGSIRQVVQWARDIDRNIWALSLGSEGRWQVFAACYNEVSRVRVFHAITADALRTLLDSGQAVASIRGCEVKP